MGSAILLQSFKKQLHRRLLNSIIRSLQGYSITSVFSSWSQIKTEAILFWFHSLKNNNLYKLSTWQWLKSSFAVSTEKGCRKASNITRFCERRDRFPTALPGFVLAAQGLGKCRAEGQFLTGPALDWVWVDASQPALGYGVSIDPSRISPSPALQDPSWWAQNIKLSLTSKKNQKNLVSRESEISLVVLAVTRVLWKL